MPTKRAGVTTWLPRLDEFATSFEFPSWDNMDYPCGAMRATGFLRPRGWVLAFEAVTCPRIDSEVSRTVFAFGPALKASGNKGTQAQIGYAFWTQSIPSPLAWFEPLLSGDKTSRFANTNYSFADSASLNAGINRLAREPELTTEVNAQWAALDRRAMRWAPLAPFLNPRSSDALGTRVDLRCYVSNTLYGVDYGRLCLKRGLAAR